MLLLYSLCTVGSGSKGMGMDILLLIVAGLFCVAAWAYTIFRMQDFNKVLVMSLAGTVILLSLAFISLAIIPGSGEQSGTREIPHLFTFFSVLTLVFKLVFIVFIIQWHFASMRQIRAMREQGIQHRKECLKMMQSTNVSIEQIREQFFKDYPPRERPND